MPCDDTLDLGAVTAVDAPPPGPSSAAISCSWGCLRALKDGGTTKRQHTIAIRLPCRSRAHTCNSLTRRHFYGQVGKIGF